MSLWHFVVVIYLFALCSRCFWLVFLVVMLVNLWPFGRFTYVIWWPPQMVSG